MKTKLLTLVICLFCALQNIKAFVEINETNFPDERFRNYMLNQSYGEDGILTDDEVLQITKIVINTPTTSATVSKMQNMKGIEYFAALKELDCSYNEIETLDLSQNKNLEILNCYGGGGSNILGLSGNKNLKAVYTGANYHKELNLSGCTALTTLDCNVDSRIETLDISGCISLTNLILPYGNMNNQWIYNINASDCTSLKEIRCFKAWVYTLDASGCTSLENIECYGNAGLNKLNVTGCTALKTLSCGGWDSGCNLGVLDVSTCTALEELSCGLTQIENLDLSNNPSLKKLGCNNTLLSSLNINNCTELTELDCSYSNLTSLDVSNNPLLSTLLCNNGQLTELNLSANMALTSLSCHENQLSELDLSNNKQLESVYCQQNKLQSLLVSGLSKLKTLWCENNLLEALSVKNNPSLTELFCSNNKLTELDVAACKALTRIDCFQNKLTRNGVDAFFESLPTLEEGTNYPIYFKGRNDDEGNECTKRQVAIAKAKGWCIYHNDYNWHPYDGATPEDVETIESEVIVSFADELKDIEDLTNTVVNDIYYNLSESNNDGYNSDEECIVLNSSMTSTDMEGITGQDITSSAIVENFSGIIFKVEGKGEIDVDCQTIGNKTLNIQIGSTQPTTATKGERGTVKVTYDTTEPTFVYIYGTSEGSAAKGFMRANAIANEDAIKIWSLTIIPTEVTDINTITMDDGRNVEIKETYDTSGRKAARLQRGLNIIKLGDGTTRKVIVK